jgi:hypothetical protein
MSYSRLLYELNMSRIWARVRQRAGCLQPRNIHNYTASTAADLSKDVECSWIFFTRHVSRPPWIRPCEECSWILFMTRHNTQRKKYTKSRKVSIAVATSVNYVDIHLRRVSTKREQKNKTNTVILSTM